DLKEFGKVERNYNTGIHVQTVDRFIKRYLRLPSEEGVLIRDVEKRSSGERAGLQIGDVILRVNNRKVNAANDIIRIIDEGFLKVGDSVYLNLWRDGESINTNMQLEEPKSKTWGF
ncbi:MAG: PDZ domain-containing protein, partial [Candidatus Marinimicrobia bacterium]|nr:PDZ domain-containing protein [Candidatus Neomarinimicrobiota bacterium]